MHNYPVSLEKLYAELSQADWSKVLYVPPHAYAPSAGWELTPDGKRRNLYFSQGIRLSKQGQASSDTRLASILSKAGQTLFPDATLPIISTANWGDLNEDYSQIGGLPSWVQDAEYPSCPECDTTMMYFAQFALSTLEPSDEGIYYMFICNDCQMSAASYQQS